jgi:hypothetical protein
LGRDTPVKTAGRQNGDKSANLRKGVPESDRRRRKTESEVPLHAPQVRNRLQTAAPTKFFRRQWTHWSGEDLKKTSWYGYLYRKREVVYFKVYKPEASSIQADAMLKLGQTSRQHVRALLMESPLTNK